MVFLNSIINWINYKRLQQLRLYDNFGKELQKEVLVKLLNTAKHTEYGKLYKFSKLKKYSDFHDQLPIHNYETIKPFINRMIKGEQNILWPGTIQWFAQSSGTTNDKSKFIPVSKESLEDCHFRGGRDVQSIYHRNYHDASALSGKSLILGGSHQISDLSNEAYYGDLSAVLIENLPFWTNFYRTPKTSIVLIDEFEEKVRQICETTLTENVTSFAGVPSWFMVLLRHILDVTGKDNILEIWPNLEVFIHGGVCFEPYKEQYKALIPSSKMRYLETYNASEGFFAIQDDPNRSDMMLMLDLGVFYEFIPMSEYGKDHPKIFPLWEIEEGINYAMVISTNGGLWRYIIGDTVQFTSKSPHRIRITGRTKHFINAFGEEMIIDNAERALKAACFATHAVIKDYTAGPIYMDEGAKGAHQWIIEFEQQPSSLSVFRNTLDKTLQTVNSDYEAKRYKNATLTHPEIVIARENLFFEWMKSRGKIGGQNKVPRLANNRIYLDPLIQLNKESKTPVKE